MNTLRDRFIEEAMTWEGTAWHHRACVKGVGVDCARLIEGVAKVVGLLQEDWQIPEYSQEFNLHHDEETLTQALAALGCVAMPKDTYIPGTILVMQYGRISSHCALLVSSPPPYILHAARDTGCVVHQRLDAQHLARVRGVYTFPGMEGHA